MRINLAILGFAALTTLSLSGCRSGAQELIVGKWKAGQGGIKVTAEFARNGTAKLTMFGQMLQGTYKLSVDELEWTLNGKTTKNKVKVTATELEVIADGGNTIIYKRE